MSFPRDSAFNQGAGQDPMEFSSAMPPLRTPEENQRIANERPKGVHLPLTVLEDWANQLQDVVDQSRDPELEAVIDSIRSYFRG